MFGLGQTKKKKETEQKVLGYKKAQQVYTGRPDEDVEAVQRKEHFSRDQGMKQTARATVKDNANVLVTETMEGNVRKDQFSREQQEKAVRIQTKKDNQDVLITDTVESEVRKEQFSRDQGWKETGRQQKSANTNFDMARYVRSAEAADRWFNSLLAMVLRRGVLCVSSETIFSRFAFSKTAELCSTNVEIWPFRFVFAL